MCAKFKQLKLVLSAAKSINKQSVSICLFFNHFQMAGARYHELRAGNRLISGVFITPNTKMKIKDLMS